MHFIDDLIADLVAWNQSVTPGAVLAYQSEILSGSAFAVTSPLDGRRSTMDASLLLASDRMAYRFDGGRFYLLTGPQHEGYPLDRLALPGQGKVLAVAAPCGTPAVEDGAEHAWAELAPALHRLEAATPPDSRPHALFGDGNFAHLIWNGWPALSVLPETGVDPSAVHFVSRCDPLGDPADLFPWLRRCQFDAWDDRHDLHRGAHFRRAAFLGSTHLPATLAGRIVTHCRSRSNALLQARCRTLADRSRRVVWLSMRRRARDCTNQVDLLAALISKLADDPGIGLILDGFSFPDCPLPDFFHDYRARVTADYEALERRCASLRRLEAEERLVVLNGVALFDAIAAGTYADAYVCHGGTQQHKLAWLHAVPGLVHVPNPSEAVEQWYAQPSEIARPPRCIPAEAIEVDADDAAAPSERSYRIDVERACEFVLDELARMLA